MTVPCQKLTLTHFQQLIADRPLISLYMQLSTSCQPVQKFLLRLTFSRFLLITESPQNSWRAEVDVCIHQMSITSDGCILPCLPLSIKTQQV